MQIPPQNELYYGIGEKSECEFVPIYEDQWRCFVYIIAAISSFQRYELRVRKAIRCISLLKLK